MVLAAFRTTLSLGSWSSSFYLTASDLPPVCPSPGHPPAHCDQLPPQSWGLSRYTSSSLQMLSCLHHQAQVSMQLTIPSPTNIDFTFWSQLTPIPERIRAITLHSRGFSVLCNTATASPVGMDCVMPLNLLSMNLSGPLSFSDTLAAEYSNWPSAATEESNRSSMGPLPHLSALCRYSGIPHSTVHLGWETESRPRPPLLVMAVWQCNSYVGTHI